MLKKGDMCVCGHERQIHHKGGFCGIFYIQPDSPLEDVIRHECNGFRLDALKYLEAKYEKKNEQK